jgi:hypothetical protein
MSDIQIKRSDGIAEFEALLRKPSTFQNELLIPNDIESGGGIGTAVAFTQFLLTWTRKSKTRRIKTYLPEGAPDKFAQFTERVHGLAAAYFSRELLSAKTGNRRRDLKDEVFRSARPRVEAMSRGDLANTGRGREVEFVLIEGARNQFHGALYSREPSPTELMDRERHGALIRSNRELNAMLERCCDHINVTKHFEKEIKRTDSVFGALLSELFKNTAEHGYRQVDGGVLDKNLRCVRIAATLIARKKLVEKTVSSQDAQEVARRYFAGIAADPSEQSPFEVRILELSIFDSGPGFVATIKSRSDAATEEPIAAVARCFQKHQSAKAAPRAGEGLARVLGVVHSLNGFIRVRTANVEAFYAANLGDPDGLDTATFVHGGLPFVEGSVVTICIPVTQ